MILLPRNKKAFSFIELAISIIIVAILIAAVISGRVLIQKSKILTAQSITKSSPVNGIRDLSLWLESSTDSSFNDGETEDQYSISAWNSIKPYGIKIVVTQSTSANRPIYSNSGTNIPTIKFNGSNQLLNFDGSLLNQSDYTIFVLEKRQSNKSSNYFFGDSSITTENQNIILGYQTDGRVIHSQAGTNSYASAVSGYSGPDESRIFTFTQDSYLGKKTYINGYLAAQSSNTAKLAGLSTIAIGKAYQGEIGEIIIFNRALKAEERESVEQYLGKKWSVKVVAGTSCTTGTVGSTGCAAGACSQVVTGVSSPIVADNGASGSAACNVAGYSGTLGYTCSSGSISVTTPCGCDSGYSPSGGFCVANCSVSQTGVSTTSVAIGSGSLTCDVSGYTGSVSYTCTSGSASIAGSCGLTPCTGGTITTLGDGTKVHKFTSSGTLNCIVGRSAKVLVVAGGGGGGGVGHGQSSGGGGAGGLIYQASYSVSSGDTSVTVGNGGASGSQGQNSAFGSSLTAIGGGRSQTFVTGYSGGSGGGGSSTSTTGGAGTSGQGNAGGNFNTFSCVDGVSGHRSTGGGGGAGAAGGDGTNGFGGAGGNGLAYDITGTSVYYAGGGGGVNRICSVPVIGAGAAGGLGGGGTGGASAGAANTGGGGGFARAGGSGVVIVSY